MRLNSCRVDFGQANERLGEKTCMRTVAWCTEDCDTTRSRYGLQGTYSNVQDGEKLEVRQAHEGCDTGSQSGDDSGEWAH